MGYVPTDRVAVRKQYHMGLKDAFEHGVDALKKEAEDVKDAISEMGHKAAAEGEVVKRDVAGDEMTLGEKAGSVFNQGKESTLAGIDATKRDLRDL
jgi:hypothetical protein